jgi:hypothetical protein
MSGWALPSFEQGLSNLEGHSDWKAAMLSQTHSRLAGGRQGEDCPSRAECSQSILSKVKCWLTAKEMA